MKKSDTQRQRDLLAKITDIKVEPTVKEIPVIK